MPTVANGRCQPSIDVVKASRFMFLREKKAKNQNSTLKMKKANLLSRAEMRKVMGGNIVLLGCDVTCFDWSGQSPSNLYTGNYTTHTTSCSPEDLAIACQLAVPVEGTCRNCVYDGTDEPQP